MRDYLCQIQAVDGKGTSLVTSVDVYRVQVGSDSQTMVGQEKGTGYFSGRDCRGRPRARNVDFSPSRAAMRCCH